MKLWDKGNSIDEQIIDFTVGNDYILDQRLVKYDCLASIAHAKMLGKMDVLTPAEVDKLVVVLNNIIDLDNNGKFSIRKEQEDCHTAIENFLTTKLGDLGKKIHTARSRNDQVLTALRLYYKAQLKDCHKNINAFIQQLTEFVSKYGEIEIPGFTHTRKAMPSSIAMWGTAVIDSMNDNLKALEFVNTLIDQSPLGSGAGYGIPLKLDREFTAKMLGFQKVQQNPIYVQNSRGKFEAALLHTLSMVMFDLNKLAVDLILFSLPEFGFFELPVRFCTGSSIMPQKKNPDVLELVRAKYHQIVAYEMQLKQMIGNLISGYHRDLQLTKEPVMNSLEITSSSVSVMAHVFSGLTVNREKCAAAMTGELYATEEAYKLVQQGMPFRDAYRKISDEY